jgi:phytoene dehydrogenase-like protein
MARPQGEARPGLDWRCLYLCGSGAHPGAGVWGAAGMNAAAEILKRARRLDAQRA